MYRTGFALAIGMLATGAAEADPWYDCFELDMPLLVEARCTEALEIGRAEGQTQFEPQIFLTRGLARAALGHVGGARADLIEAMPFYDANSQVMDQIATALLGVGDAGNALIAAEAAVQGEDAEPFNRNTLGLALCRNGRDADALDVFAAAEAGAGSSVGWVQLAWAAEAGFYDGPLTEWSSSALTDWVGALCP